MCRRRKNAIFLAPIDIYSRLEIETNNPRKYHFVDSTGLAATIRRYQRHWRRLLTTNPILSTKWYVRGLLVSISNLLVFLFLAVCEANFSSHLVQRTAKAFRFSASSFTEINCRILSCLIRHNDMFNNTTIIILEYISSSS